MHKQNRTDREVGLENIMEDMYTEGLGGRPGELGPSPYTIQTRADFADELSAKGQHDVAQQVRNNALNASKKIKCTHCKGTGEHADGSKCPKCKGTGEMMTEADYVPPHDEDKLKRAKQRGYDGLDDQHAKYVDEKEMQDVISLMADEDGRYRNFIQWGADTMRKIGKEAFEAKWAAFIQDLEGNTDDTNKGAVPSSRDYSDKALNNPYTAYPTG